MLNLRNWYSLFLWVLIGGLALSVVIPVYAYFFYQSLEPSSVPIKLSEIGVVADFNLKVKKHFIYSFEMSFVYPENDQAERTRVRKLLGDITLDKLGKPTKPGTPTPVRLDIFAVCKDGKEVAIYSLDADPILTSWGDGNFGRFVGKNILIPGNYRVRLFNKRASPEFLSIPIKLEIGMPAKVMFNPEKNSTRNEPC